MAAIKAALPVVALLCIAVCALASVRERFGEQPKPLSFSQDKDLDHKIDKRDVWSRHNYISHNRRKRSLVVDSNLAEVSYLDIPLSSLVVHSRQRRAVTDIPEVSVQFSENQAGQVLSFANYVPRNVSRTYMLVSSSVDSTLFTLSSLGTLNWISANSLDYETTKTVTIVVNATSTVDQADVYVIRARINVTDVNEPAVFITKPQPYQATLTTIAPQDTLVISLQAQDPDAGASVGYSLTSVSPSNLRSRFTLIEVGPSGARICEIRTVGSGQFTQGQEISITVTAKDTNDATASPTTTTVSVLVGFLPPQFMELFYEGYAQENNQPMQMVYTQPDGNVPLKIETKSFQPSPVSYSLLNSYGQPSSDFTVDSDAVVKSLQTIDYETAPSPQVQLTVRAVQVVGTTTLISSASVLIRLVDINDNSPEFEMSRYLAEIPENTTVGTAILEVKATDRDSGTNAIITYSLRETQDFSITTVTRNGSYVGIMSVKQRLDYDRTPNHYYDFVVVAADQGKPTSRTSTTSARVFVRNTNDEAPMFTNEPGKTFTVAQGLPVNSVIAQIQATDLDGDRVRYSFTGSQNKFSLAQDTGIITLLSAFTQDDYEFVLNITARDDGSCCGGGTSLSNTTYIVIQVMGTNNNKPTFTTCSAYDLSNVFEESPNNSFVIQVSATDQDRGLNGRLTYTLVRPEQYLKIVPTNGTIYVSGRIDREAPNMEKYIQVTVYAEDGGNPSLQGWCAFRLQVQDINDNAPYFDKTQYVSNITIDTRVGTTFLTVRAYDNDTGVNAEVEYSFLDSSNGTFGIVSSNGFIYLGKLLQQGKTQYSLRVMAKDKGVPPLNSTVSVTVNVIISSNKPPSFDKNYTGMVYTVNETAAQGFPIIQDITCNSNIDDPRVDFQLADANSGTYDTSQFFYIRKSDSSPNKATVYSNGVFDFETKQSHIVRLRCLNYGSVTLSTEINPVVQLLDANNKRPTFVGTDGDGRFQGSVTENMDPGQECLTITGQDLDVTPDFSKLTFEISAADNGTNNMDFELVWKDNRSAVLKSKRSFDRESKELYLINVIAKDGAPSAYPNVAPNPNSGSVTVRVLINDVNDNPPYFEQTLYNLTVPEDFNLNTLIEPYITAEDPDSSDSNRLTYFIDSGNGQIPTFGVREGNGGLFLVRKLDYENNDRFFQLKLRAFDGIHSATTTVNVLVTDVNDNSPVLLPSSLIIRNIVEEDQSVRNNPRLLLQFNVTDADVDRPNKFQFSITSTSLLSFFRIDSTTGQLFLTDKLDRDLPNGRDTYIVDVQVTDELTNPLSGFASVSVLPLDINDNDPMFVSSSLVGSVNENSEKGSSVMLVQVFDPDYMENGTVVFSILNSYTKNATGNYFAIDANTGYVTTNVAKELLDREKDPELYMVVKLADKGTPPRSTTGTITISLTDVNDNPPIFQEKIYKVEMSESLPVGGNVVSVTATDADIGVNANLIYDLQSSADRKYFDILTTKNVGNIIVFKAVDYDPPMNERFFNLTVSVTDGRFTDTCYVEIKVTDFNDNAPQIQPQSVTVNISENVVVDYLLANFSATDIDEGINSVFQFSIDRQTDLLRQFTVDPSSGVVRVRRPLDRETTPSYSLHILAIDEGNPVQTGTATLNVILGDVNDNYPTFKDNYRPQVPENDPNYRDIQTIFAKDPDLPPFSFPYGFNLAPCNDNDVCQAFGFRVDRAGDNGNGTAVITSKMTYDREKRKYYLIPIIMWDMYGTGSSLSQTGTNTLTVTIADKNDNPMKEGHQDIFVFNYKGMFGPIDIGRVYVNDPDDWDLPDKTFTFLEPKWMEAYFKVQSNGTIVMEKGVPSNSDKEKYTFSVEVVDNVRKEKVVATVSVVVNDLSDEAVRSSGAVRLQGISAEDFIKRPPMDASTYGESPYDKFRKLLAAKLGTALENVLIISVQDVEGGDYTDVRYTAHGSPYYQSSQTDSLVVNNLQEFENTAGVSISQVPIDMCAQEIFEGGCYNYLDITGRPAMVNANGTSFVGVEAFVRAREGCRAKDFPDPVECSGNYCYNGGTCQKDDFGVLSCLCLSGYDGPRCQQLRHSFDGKSYAMYPTLEQCEDGQTSIEFITTQSDGLLLYNGPKVTPPADQPPDFISLELRGGFPVLMIDHGSGSTTLTVDGKNANGNAVISTLADGKWHRIDIIRTGKHVEMIVDFCEIAAAKSGGGTLDDRPCRATGNTPGTYSFLNVGTLLQVGGRQPSTTYPRNVVGTGFNGCVRNLRHNSKLYDLYYKEIAGVSSGQNGCPREDEICRVTCGDNGVCTANLTPPQATCVCKPGWRGDQCTTATTIRDLGKAPTYLTWTLSSSLLTSLPLYKVEMQAMFRTRSKTGVIFATYGRISSQYIVVQIQNGTLQVIYNLDDIEKTLELSHGNVSNGQWHVVRVMRNLQHVTLILDGGEGRNYNFSRGNPTGNFSVTLRDTATVGAVMSSLQGQTVYDRNLIDTCVQDIRLNNVGFPMTRSENTNTGQVSLTLEMNVKDGCTRNDCASNLCPLGTFCYPLWGMSECRCNPGTHYSGKTCMSDCTPNPCFNDVQCSINNGSAFCTCPPEWCGPLCQYYMTSSMCGGINDDQYDSAGITAGGIAAIVVSIIAALLIVLFAVLFFTYCRKKELEKVVLEDEDDYDIRENVIYYNEEGAGEEDQNAYDLDTLRKPVRELQPDIRNAPLRREPQLGRAVPGDRPDVGDTIHDRMRDADDDSDAPPYDTIHEFNVEGGGSDAGSLSSLATSSTDTSQDYDYLNDWGPKFAKLADMYGAGQDDEA